MTSAIKKIGDRSGEPDTELGNGVWNHSIVRPSTPPRPGSQSFSSADTGGNSQTVIAAPQAKVRSALAGVIQSDDQNGAEAQSVEGTIADKVYPLIDHIELLIPSTTFSTAGFLRGRHKSKKSLIPPGSSTILDGTFEEDSTTSVNWASRVAISHQYALAGAILEAIDFVTAETPALPRVGLIKEILKHVSPEYRYAVRSLMNSALNGNIQLLTLSERDRIELVITKIFDENPVNPDVPLFSDVSCSAPSLAVRTFIEKVRTLPPQNQLEQNIPVAAAVDYAVHKLESALAGEPDEKGRVQTFFSTLMLVASQPESFFVGIKREQHMHTLALFFDAIQSVILRFKKNNIVVGGREKSLDEFIRNFCNEMLQAFEQTAYSSVRTNAGRGMSGTLHQEALRPFFDASGMSDITHGNFKLKPARLRLSSPLDRVDELQPGHPRTSTAQAFHEVKRSIDLTPGSWDVETVRALLAEHLRNFGGKDADGRDTSIVDVSFHIGELRSAMQSYIDEAGSKLMPAEAPFAQLARTLLDALADFDTGMNASLSMLQVKMLELPSIISSRIMGKQESSPLPLLGAFMIAEEVQAKCESYHMLLVLFERVKLALSRTIDYQFDAAMIESLNALIELERHLEFVKREIDELTSKSEITFGDNLRLSVLKRTIDDQSSNGVFADRLKAAVESLVSSIEYAHATLIASSPTSGAQPVPQPPPFLSPLRPDLPTAPPLEQLQDPQQMLAAQDTDVDVEIEPVDEEAQVESSIAVASPMTNAQPVLHLNESISTASHTAPSQPDSNAKYAGMGTAISLAAVTGAAAGLLAYLYQRSTNEIPDESAGTSVAKKHTQGTGTESDGSASTQVTFEHFDYEVALAPFLPSEEVQYLDESDGIPYLDEDAVVAEIESDEFDSHKVQNEQLQLSGNLAQNIARGITLKLSGVFGRAREKLEGIRFRSSDERVDYQPKQRLIDERSLTMQGAARKLINIGVLGAYLAGSLGGTEKNTHIDTHEAKAAATSAQSVQQPHTNIAQKVHTVEDHTQVLSDMSERLLDGTMQAPLADFSRGNTGARAFTSALHGPLINNAVEVANAQFNNASLVVVAVAKNEGFTQATDRTIGELALQNYLLTHDEIDTPEEEQAAKKAMQSVVGGIKPAEALGLFTAGLATDHPINHKLFDAFDKNPDGTLKLNGNVNLVAKPTSTNHASGFVLDTEAAPVKSRIIDLSKKIEEKLAQNMERDHKSQKNQSMFGSIFKSVKSFVKKFA